MIARDWLLFLWIACCLLPLPSSAQEAVAVSPLEQAKAHYATAQQAFEAGQFEIARIEFEAALGLLPPDGSAKNAEIHSATLFNLALVAERRKDYDACRRYIALFRHSSQEPDKDEALKTLEARLPPLNEASSPAVQKRRGVSSRTLAGPAVLLALGGVSLLSATVPAALGGGLSRMVETMPVTPSQLAAFDAEGTRLNATAITLCVIGGGLVVGGGVWLGIVYGRQHKTP